MIDLNQIRFQVIRPALQAIDLWSEEAEELVFHTGYVESLYKYIAQVGGPARSFWQIEPTTLFDIYETYLRYREDLQEKVDSLIGGGHTGVDLPFQLTVNMAFGAALCRIKYRRSPIQIPAVGDIEWQAQIWKQAYNTPQGAGTKEKFITLVEGIK